jgi:hypothetical protein
LAATPQIGARNELQPNAGGGDKPVLSLVLAIVDFNAKDAWDGVPENEQKAIYGEYAALTEAPGIFGGSQLQPVESATTVRVENGQTLLTAGPFVDAKEYLGGFYLLEADDLDAAAAIAARIPAARMGGAVEVRPIVES